MGPWTHEDSLHSRRSRVRSSVNREKLISMRIASAIREKSCPICLSCIEDRKAAVIRVCMHAYCVDCIRKWSELKRNCPLCNAEFDSWFVKIRPSAGKFEVERLSNRNERKKIDDGSGFRIHRSGRDRLVIRSSRDELDSVYRRSRPVPWRRSFGESSSLPSDISAERVQWRASIYNRRLQAVPFPTKNCLVQNISGNNNVKERMLQRVEPWIRRELQAILGDPDPSVIVHLATSLWISSLEEKLKSSSKDLVVEDKYVESMQPFLYDQTDMFWHELRCFAESSFTLETYDSVVEYKRLN